MIKPDHNDEGDWSPVLLWILAGCCLTPFVWMLVKVFILKGN